MNYIHMLSRLGMGSAHPGGFEATLRMLKNYPIQPGSRILEVGCGTGRTACHLSEMGYQVTAIDLNENMIKKPAQEPKPWARTCSSCRRMYAHCLSKTTGLI